MFHYHQMLIKMLILQFVSGGRGGVGGGVYAVTWKHLCNTESPTVLYTEDA